MTTRFRVHRLPRIAVASVLCLCGAVATAEDGTNDEVVAAIRQRAAQMDRAWLAADPTSLLSEVLSSRAFAHTLPSPTSPGEALVMDKEAFCKWFEQWPVDERPRKRAHHPEHLAVRGPLAYELAMIGQVMPNGRERTDSILCVWAKEDVGWRLVFSTDAQGVRQALRGSDADRHAVRKLAKEFVGAFDPRNATGPMRLNDVVADDVVGVMSWGQLVRGKEALLELYARDRAEIRKNFNEFGINYDIQSVRLLGDGAVVFGKLTIKGRAKENNERVEREVWETLVFRRDTEGWRVVEEHSTRVPEVPPAAGSGGGGMVDPHT